MCIHGTTEMEVSARILPFLYKQSTACSLVGEVSKMDEENIEKVASAAISALATDVLASTYISCREV